MFKEYLKYTEIFTQNYVKWLNLISFRGIQTAENTDLTDAIPIGKNNQQFLGTYLSHTVYNNHHYPSTI